MSRLAASKRARLPASAFAYVDSRGRRRLPIHDEAHVRNALARFSQVGFEDDAARERTRTRLLNAAKKYGIVPVGFITGQLQSERGNATAGRLVIELGRHGAPGELEKRLRSVLRDPTLAVLHWSDASGAYLDGTGTPVPLPAEGDQRGVTFLERQGRPMTALVHDPTVLNDPGIAQTVLAAVRFVVEKELLHGQIQATSTDAAALPTGFVTLLMTDIEASTGLLRRLGDRYGGLLNDVRVRVGIHSGRPTLTDVGYIGLAVHTTARVCSAAHGGQIVVSTNTRAAVRTSAPAGIRFRNLGRHRLPGLPEVETLFQVQAKGLRPRFPKPRIARRSTPRTSVSVRPRRRP